jgi:hypothetical protein
MQPDRTLSLFHPWHPHRTISALELFTAYPPTVFTP